MLRSSIEGARSLDDGVWITSLSPDIAMSLGRPQAEEAGPTVLFVPEPRFNEVAGTLDFPHGAARLVNLGTSDQTLIVRTQGQNEGNKPARTEDALKSGDRAFLREAGTCGGAVSDLAPELLRAIRKLDPEGELVRFGTRRFINQADNFVTLIPQPRVRDIRLVVRGSPSEFGTIGMTVKKDQNGYSTFKVATAKDLSRAISLLSLVRRKR